MELQRSSGILLPISSLPSPHGIGTFGKSAYQFIDFLAEAGQSWWQILPLTTTGYGNSPYQSFSAFAGNPYFIDLDLLVEAGLLSPQDLATVDFGQDPTRVDYGKIYAHRQDLLNKAAAKGIAQEELDFVQFKAENAYWLDDYAIFMVLKQKFGMASWLDWPDQALKLRERDKLDQVIQEEHQAINLICYIQYLFFSQWQGVRSYAAEKGISIMGDIPLYVSMDSADVWARPENFQLDENGCPTEVSGVPPDYFTADGQLWSNPLYDWAKMKEDDFSWWTSRISFSNAIYDALRIDHFRGLESYWAVPYGEKTAKNGRWVKGPGMDLLSILKSKFPDFIFIAEDLGYQTAAVQQLLEDSGFPGMNVLQLAFDFRDEGNSLPHDFIQNSSCYIGTHDNAPIMLWQKTASQKDLDRAKLYFGLNPEEGFNWGFIRAGMGSVSKLFVCQMQDYLGLAEGSRMNRPGFLADNWEWRLTPEQISPELTQKIRLYTELFGRLKHTGQ